MSDQNKIDFFIQFIDEAYHNIDHITAKDVLDQLKAIDELDMLDFFSRSSLLWVIEWIRMREEMK